jgi:hypothetical protein
LSYQDLEVGDSWEAAQELVEAWVTEKRAHGETVPTERNPVIAQIEVADALLRP